MTQHREYFDAATSFADYGYDYDSSETGINLVLELGNGGNVAVFAGSRDSIRNLLSKALTALNVDLFQAKITMDRANPDRSHSTITQYSPEFASVIDAWQWVVERQIDTEKSRVVNGGGPYSSIVNTFESLVDTAFTGDDIYTLAMDITSPFIDSNIDEKLLGYVKFTYDFTYFRVDIEIIEGN